MSTFLASSLALANAALCFLVGLMVFLRDMRSRINQVFMLLCLSVAYWAFMEFELRHSVTFEQADFWHQLNFLWPFTIALFVNFLLIFTDQRRFTGNRLTYLVLYGIAGTITLLWVLDTRQMRGTPFRRSWGWAFDPSDTPLFRYSIAVVLVLAIFAIFLTARFYQKQTDPAKKKETRMVLIGLAIPVIVGSAADAILPLFGIRFPEMVTTAFTVGVAGFIGFAIWKYELFGLTPARAADKIISAISDCLFLVDPAGRILMVNQAALDLLGYREEELVGERVHQIFQEFQFNAEHVDRDGPIEPSLGICDIEAVFFDEGRGSDSGIPVRFRHA